MNLSDRPAAVVTGGASGLGAATARRLAAAGARVAVFDMSPAGRAVADEIGGVSAEVDVTDAASLERGFAVARKAHGQERILVNCAGIVLGAKTLSRGAVHDFAAFAKVLDVNLAGTFRAAALSALGMSTTEPVTEDGERGVIVCTASCAAFEGQIGQAAYSASKGGVAAMTLPLARDLSQYGIRVVTIAPGIMETPMLMGMTDEVRTSLGAQVPFPKRLGRPDEYARMVAAIVENGLLNGEVIRLDGGIRMGPR